MTIRQQLKQTSLINKAAFDRALKVKREGAWCEIDRKPVPKNPAYLLTFYDFRMIGGTKVRKYLFQAEDATTYAYMMEYFDALPIARQIKNAGISYAISTERKSSLVLHLSEDDHMLVMMSLRPEMELRRYDETPEFRKGVTITPQP